ncbi:MAG: hypothetical protein LUF32_05875 [Clostridiales bacterium]|nr:hypothetical protein [Clostridiales bacterium]
MDIKDLLEARGTITARMFAKRRNVTETDICRACCELAQANLKNAETEHQGSYAITNCFRYLEGKEAYKWRLSLLYDFEYLMQRKSLFIFLLQRCREYGIGKTEGINRCEGLLYKQQQILGDLYMYLNKTGEISKENFCLLSGMEKELSEISRILL